MKNQFLKTTEKFTTENYPYGFRLKTTKIDWLEFSQKHGFRHVTQTINPKTGKPNNPKKSTYYDLMVLGMNEDGHLKSRAYSFNGDDQEKVFVMKFIYENWDLFTTQQHEYFYTLMISMLKVMSHAKVVYCGANWDQLKPLISEAVEILVKGVKSKGTVNFWGEVLNSLDWVKIKACEVPGFNPFVVKEVIRLV
jgi:hypothetical protein